MNKNKLHKMFMYALAFLMTCMTSYLLGFCLFSVIDNIAISAVYIFYKPLYDLIMDNFLRVILIGSIIPSIVIFILIWKKA